MLKSYLTIALRNLRRQKGYAFINIAGMAMGMACCLLIVLYVRHELSYDRFHAKAGRTYRITTTTEMGQGEIPVPAPGPLGPTLVQLLPGVEDQARVRCTDQAFVVQRGVERFTEPGLCYADPSLFDVFDFSLASGTSTLALAEPNSLVLSGELSRKFFGDEDPVGQMLELDGDQTYIVTGVLAPPPGNTHLQFGLIASFATLEARDPLVATWAQGGASPYVVLTSDYSPERLQAHLDEALDTYMGYFANGLKAHVEALPDIYLHSTYPPSHVERRADVQYIYLFSTVAAFILLVAGINYMNLATARALRRGREVGVRKVVGATRTQLVRQFLSESVLLSALAFVTAFVLAALLLPSFGRMVGRTFEPVELLDGNVLLVSAAIMLFVGILAGSYPAFYLSAYKPVAVLKGRMPVDRRGTLLRKGLITAQFIVSIGLAACTLVLWNQLDYVRSSNLGFDTDNIVLIEPNEAVRPQYAALKGELLRLPGVAGVTTAPFPGWTHVVITTSQPEGYQRGADEQLPDFPTYEVDSEFLPTLGIELVTGRNLDANRPGDLEGSVLINETLARELGWENPLGKEISQPTRQNGKWVWISAQVVGVVSDFHNATMKLAVNPVVIRLHSPDNIDPFGKIIVKLTGENVSRTLADIERTWGAFSPDHPFVYTFLDAQVDQFYEDDIRLGNLLSVFAVLAILIACLGLFGLAAYMAEQRTKEIGIRKILGATVPGVVSLLSKDFLKLVIIAFIISVPVAWYLMNRWLEEFTYRIGIGPGIFLLAGALAVLIALATVSYQAVKAALADPVKSLRYE
jgi:putative ABC transport system permease protein